jgi:hypothetical protein
MVERSLSTDTIREEIDSSAGEAEARRDHATAMKKEAASWDAVRKRLAAEKLTCKDASQTKANNAKFAEAQTQHDLVVAHANVSDPS